MRYRNLLKNILCFGFGILLIYIYGCDQGLDMMPPEQYTVPLPLDLTEGLVGYWPLDGNGDDLYGHDAKLKTGAKWSDNGWVNGAVEFDGAGGHAVVDTFELTTDEITVIARINGWKTIGYSGIVVARSHKPIRFGDNIHSVDHSFWMGVDPNNTLTYVWNNNNVETWNWRGAPEIPENKWALIAIAIEPDKATSYVYHRDNGKLDAAVNDIPHIEQTVTNLKFGWDECCGARYFKGLIDEVMIYDRTLDADDIKKLATVGLPVESKEKLAVTWATLQSD